MVNDPGNMDADSNSNPDLSWSGFDLDAVAGINYE